MKNRKSGESADRLRGRYALRPAKPDVGNANEGRCSMVQLSDYEAWDRIWHKCGLFNVKGKDIRDYE